MARRWLLWLGLVAVVLVTAVSERSFESRYLWRLRALGGSPASAPGANPTPGVSPTASPPSKRFSPRQVTSVILTEDEGINPTIYIKPSSGSKKLEELPEVGSDGQRRFRSFGFRIAAKSFFASAAFLRTQGYVRGEVAWMRSSAYLFEDASGAARALDLLRGQTQGRYQGLGQTPARGLGEESYGLSRTDQITILAYGWRRANLVLVLETVGGVGALEPADGLRLARKMEVRARKAG